MILGNSLEAIVEACYLGESLTKKTGRANILVNPKDYLDYIIGRTIIINSDVIPIDTIKTLQENKNKIICRVKREDFPYYPYVLRVNFNVRWNGQILECPKTNIPEISSWIWGSEDFELEFDTGEKPVMYFPKIKGIPRELLIDECGNLNFLGWVLQQVGVNVTLETKFHDMDVIKTKKLVTLPE